MDIWGEDMVNCELYLLQFSRSPLFFLMEVNGSDADAAHFFYKMRRVSPKNIENGVDHGFC